MTTKTYEHRASSEAQPARPNTEPRSQKRLDWHTCMPPVDWLHRHPRVSPAFIPRPSPPGLNALQTVRWKASAFQPAYGPATEPLRSAHRASPGRSPECLRALTGTSGFHRTPPGVHRSPLRRSPADHPSRTGPSEAQSHDLRQLGRLRLSVGACVRHRTPSDVHRNLRVPPGSPRRPIEASLSILAVPRR